MQHFGLPYLRLSFLILLVLGLSCKKDESNPVVGAPPSLTGTTWNLQSVGFSYSGTLLDSPGWKTYIMNSGLAAVLGTAKLTLADTSFNMVVKLDTIFSQYFPYVGLGGFCNGKFHRKDNLLIFAADSTSHIFQPGRANQEAYGTYQYEGYDLVLDVVIPTYRYSFTAPNYIRVGEEYYHCRFRAN